MNLRLCRAKLSGMKTLFKIILFSLILLAAVVTGWFANENLSRIDSASIPASLQETLRPFEKYTMEHLMKKDIQPGSLTLGKEISEKDEEFISKMFYMEFDPTLEGTQTKKVSGVLTTPKKSGKYPLVVMLRGFVDQTIYTSGMGTRPAAEYFAENGFVSIAPDFLGYGESDSESDNIFETRFQTYTTTLTLLKTLDDPAFAEIMADNWDGQNIFIWAHSNGGQVALTTLAASGKEYPTTLWAPVTAAFPYSVLFYTNESADGGKFIRRELAKFETDYDTDKFTFTKHLENIKAPIQLHQGDSDDAIPTEWSDSLVKKLKDLEVKVEYFKYSGADHNLRPSWDTVVERDIKFFNEHLTPKT